MDVSQRVRNLLGDQQTIAKIARASTAKGSAQSLAFDIFHDQKRTPEIFAVVVESDHVLMRKLARDPRLLNQPCLRGFVGKSSFSQNLEGHGPP